MKTTQTIPRASALIIAAALATIALTPTDAAAEEVSVMRHSTPPLPGYGVLALEIWTDGTDVQVIGLDAQGRIVLAREGTMRSEPTLEGTGGIEGVLPAEQLWFDSGGRLAYERCARPHCARAIAAKAEAVVRASAMGPADGASGGTIMAKLCPTIELDATHAHAPSEAIAALAANAPCKWRPVPIEDLQPIPGVGRRTLVRIGTAIGTAVHELRQAPWAIRPDPR